LALLYIALLPLTNALDGRAQVGASLSAAYVSY
jgi:hypothetical protein